MPKAARTPEQTRLSREQRIALKNRLATARNECIGQIQDIARTFNKKESWVGGQLYLGGAIAKKRRAPNLFNAYLHKTASLNRENNAGRGFLPSISHHVASQNWKAMSTDERKKMITDLEETRERRNNTPIVSRKARVEHYEGTMKNIENELAGLSHRVDCQYMLITANNDPFRPLRQHATATQKMTNACTHLFKNTFDEVATRMESFTTAGLEGTLKAMGTKRINILKKEGRELILSGLHEILISEKGMLPEKLPPRMQYTRYDSFVVSLGVHLVGWPEIDVDGNPVMDLDKLKTVPQWQRLLEALKSGTCRWVALTDEEWATKKDEVRKDESMRATQRHHKPKGRHHGQKSNQARKAREPTSQRFVDTSDDDDEGSSSNA